MTDIERMAKEADDFADEQTQSWGEFHPNWSEARDAKFAALIVEECAKECDKFIASIQPSTDDQPGMRFYLPIIEGAKACRQMIRAKFALSGGEDAAK